MADRSVDILLVGGGIASAMAAETLRAEGFDGSILLVGREPHPPYHRPPASKEYLRGEHGVDDALVHPGAWWDEHDVELLTRTSVLELDPSARTAKLSTKEEVGFDRALVATGAMVRRLQVEGAQLEGIHYLRALGNADTIRADAEGAERVLCVGGSYIASEVAASLTSLGRTVTMVMLENDPLERTFGPEAGAFFRRVLEEHGVEVIGGDEVARFEGSERVERVVTQGGRELAAQAVVCGVGALPDVMLARKSGLALGKLGGVLCDSRLRTSAEGVFAAGDMCEYESVVHGRFVRIEHEEVAAAQGRTAARNMLGADVPHDEVPYFFSDLADWASLEYVGPAFEWDSEEIEGSVEDAAFAVWYREAGTVRAMLSVGGFGDLDRARELIRGSSAIDRRS
jgi:3-phenylpropionate/trans-cinnamate dioxygenase ferredoxin reductase component